MKLNLLVLFVLCTLTSNAQNLEGLIAKDAKVVIEINGDQIFSLIDYTDLQGFIPPDPSGQPTDFNQFGIDLEAKAYYFYQVIDSIAYQNVAFRVLDVEKTEEMFRGIMPNSGTKISGYTVAMQDNMTAAWTSDMAIFSYADFPKKVYTIEDLIAEREAERDYDDTGDDYPDLDMTGDGEEYEEEEDDYESLEFELLMRNMDAPSLYSESEIKDMMLAHFGDIVGTQPSQSVLTNGKYLAGKDKKSTAYFWMGSFDDMMSDMYPADLMSMLGESSPFGEMGSMSMGMEEVFANLFFDEDAIRFETKVGLNDKVAPSYNKIYNSSMDKGFLKHFNADEAMSYISFTTDMAATMKAYPELITNTYGTMFADYADEVSIVADLIEVILDEDAIAELITGDGMIVLHDIAEREVTYMATEYDDDFNATEVERTKMEPLPTFSIMIGSENERMIAKLMKLARKYEVATNLGMYHALASAEMGAPFDLFFTQHDGIAFLTNSKERVTNYATGVKNCNLGQHKHALKNNVFTMYVDAAATMEKLSSMIPADPTTMDYMKANFKDMSLSMGKIQNNQIGYDMVIHTSTGKGNSLKLILDTLKMMSGM